MVADPGDRQIGDDLVALGQLVEAAADLGGRVDDVVVGQHHALRAAGRARGVEDDGEVRALAVAASSRSSSAAASGPASRRFRPSSITSVDARAGGRGRSRAGRAPRRRGCAASVGTRSATARSLSTCSWSCDHRERDLGMREHVGHLVGDRVGVDRHRHGAEPLRRRHRPIEPRPVVADDRDLVAALEPERREPDREGAHDLVHLGPGPGLPDAEILVAERRSPRPQTCVAHQIASERCRRCRPSPSSRSEPPLTDRAPPVRPASLALQADPPCVGCALFHGSGWNATRRDATRLPPGERPPPDRRRSRLGAPQRRRAATLLGGDRQRRRRRAETGEKLGLLPLCRLEVAGLDVAEAADLLRQVGEADRDGVVLRRRASRRSRRAAPRSRR